jgi:hypothetical protein
VPHGPTVPGERCPKQALVLAQPTLLGATAPDDDPGADCDRVPATLAGDDEPQAAPAVHRGDQLLGVRELGLELDDEQAPRLGMPRQDVDDASLAIVREGDLRQPGPPGELSKTSGHGLVQLRVCGVHEAIKVGALPAGPYVQPGPERGGDGSGGIERVASRRPALQPADELARDTSAARDVHLAEMLADADDAQGVADADVIHAGTMATVTSRRLRGGFNGLAAGGTVAAEPLARGQRCGRYHGHSEP